MWCATACPLRGACGRVCHHPCESECNRGQIDAPVSVRNLKRFVSDYEWDRIRAGESVERPPSEAVVPEKGDYAERVAVVGGGPAGLTCANSLAKRGYAVTVYDANPELGGMMRTGIPAYRLPRDVLDYEIDLMLAEGVEVQAGKALGKDFTLEQLSEEGFGSVFLATGAQLPKKIPLEGSDTEGFLYGIPFLRGVNSGEPPRLGKRIVVIGGGNVAMDVARCAMRVADDASVALYCLESRDEMPAHDWEIREAEEEGVVVNPSWGPGKVLADGGALRGVELIRCTSVFDADHHFNPAFDTDERTTVEADTVILAVGTGVRSVFSRRRRSSEPRRNRGGPLDAANVGSRRVCRRRQRVGTRVAGRGRRTGPSGRRIHPPLSARRRPDDGTGAGRAPRPPLRIRRLGQTAVRWRATMCRYRTRRSGAGPLSRSTAGTRKKWRWPNPSGASTAACVRCAASACGCAKRTPSTTT